MMDGWKDRWSYVCVCVLMNRWVDEYVSVCVCVCLYTRKMCLYRWMMDG